MAEGQLACPMYMTDYTDSYTIYMDQKWRSKQCILREQKPNGGFGTIPEIFFPQICSLNSVKGHSLMPRTNIYLLFGYYG